MLEIVNLRVGGLLGPNETSIAEDHRVLIVQPSKQVSLGLEGNSEMSMQDAA
jgi:hypothetical protein